MRVDRLLPLHNQPSHLLPPLYDLIFRKNEGSNYWQEKDQLDLMIYWARKETKGKDVVHGCMVVLMYAGGTRLVI